MLTSRPQGYWLAFVLISWEGFFFPNCLLQTVSYYLWCILVMNNQSQITVRDFQEYNAEVTGLLLPIHNGTILLIIWISFKVQKAVFKTLDRLGSRHINTIIKTNLVILHDLLMLLMCTYYVTRKYPLRRYILGVLTHTTAWDRHWWVDESLKWVLMYIARLCIA